MSDEPNPVPGSDAPTSPARAVARARIATPHAARYLAQLCKHFQHKRPVTFDERLGHIAFTAGDCRLEADTDVLALTVVAADAAGRAQLEDVVARHLLRFAFREDLRIDWTPVPGEEPA